MNDPTQHATMPYGLVAIPSSHAAEAKAKSSGKGAETGIAHSSR